MNIEERLQALNLVLPNPPKPLGIYVPAVEAGGLLFVSGMLPVKEARGGGGLATLGRNLLSQRDVKRRNWLRSTVWPWCGPRSALSIASGVWRG